MEDQIQEDLEEIKPSLLHRIIIICIAFFLLFIMLYYFVGSQIDQNILSSLISKPFDEKHLVGNNTIRFQAEVIETIKSDYILDYKYEKKWCLLGNKKDSEFLITDIYYPEIIERNITFIRTKPCPVQTIISLHSHPFRSCLPSKQDWSSFLGSPVLFFGVICDVDEILFYAKKEAYNASLFS